LPVNLGSISISEILNNGYWSFTPTGTLSNNYDISLTRNGQDNAGLTLNSHGIAKRATSSAPWSG
jgi:hypothetical protein